MMDVSLDTDITIHLYNVGKEELLFKYFDKIYIHEFILEKEMKNKSIDVYNKIHNEINNGKIILVNQRYFIDIGMKKSFEDKLYEVKKLFDFGEANAVLAGDALLTFAPQLIIEKTEGLFKERLINVLHEYTKFAGVYGLIAGQVVDIDSEKGVFENTSKEETLDFIHLNKTATLFRLAMRTGAIIAGADTRIIEKFDKFATTFGMAFQIYDDIMDEISSFEEMGKTIGKDKNAGKLTYVSLYGLENAKKKFNENIKICYDIINNYDSKIIKEILDKLSKRINGV